MNVVVNFHAREEQDKEYLVYRKLTETMLENVDYENVYDTSNWLCYFTDQNDIPEWRMEASQFDLTPFDHTAIFSTMQDKRYWMTIKKVRE